MHSTHIILGMLLALAEVGIAVSTIAQDITAVQHNAADVQQYPSKQLPIMSRRRQLFDVESNDRCGKSNDGAKCDESSFGQCCSEYDWCGFTDQYCGKGCQSEYGECGSIATAESLPEPSHRPKHCGPKHKNQKCRDGECCSKNGKCGHGSAFCGKHCQPDFGTCDPKDKPPHSQEPKPKERPHRCGKDHGDVKCVDGECCSGAGYCGRGNDYCQVPQECQRGYGYCDSDATPQGLALDTTRAIYRRSKVPFGQTISKCTKPNTVAFTFDDGPSNNTEKILDLLRAHNAKATFFLSGNTNGKGMIDTHDVWIKAVKRMITEGHQIGSHTWSHPHLDRLSRDGRLTDMLRNDRAIANIVGKLPTYMRAPYIECNSTSGCLTDMADLGYHVISWDIDSHDWEEKTTLNQMRYLIDAAMVDDKRNNMMLIQHDHNKHAVELTEYALKEIEKKKWKAVTVGECLNEPAENWHRELIWVGAKSIAPNGCVVAGVNFCGTLRPFHDHKTCRQSLKQCEKDEKNCKNTSRVSHAVCKRYKKVCKAQKRFCHSCKKGKNLCKSDKWEFNRH